MSDSPLPSRSSAVASMQPQEEELSLSHAMKAADSIRRHFHQAQEQQQTRRNDSTSSSSSSMPMFAPIIPPGIAQGIGACLVVGVALLPVRRLVLTHPSVHSHPPFRNFMDLVVSVGHTLVAAQAALMTGSIYGGKAYLDEFAKQKSSELTDLSSSAPASSFMLSNSICKELTSTVVPPGTRQPAGLDKESFDPRVQTMLSMVRVIELCQEIES